MHIIRGVFGFLEVSRLVTFLRRAKVTDRQETVCYDIVVLPVHEFNAALVEVIQAAGATLGYWSIPLGPTPFLRSRQR